MEAAIRKAKVAKKKLERSPLQNLDICYLRQKEGQCIYCGDKWSPGHICNNQYHIAMKQKMNQTPLVATATKTEKEENQVL